MKKIFAKAHFGLYGDGVANECTSSPPSAAPGPGPRARRWGQRGVRLLLLVAGSFLIAQLLDVSARTATQRATPAGFGLGVLHGACMPATWPALLLGRDPVIYAGDNNGRRYKLGYALGVNLCGALFFGALFWRWQNWRRTKPKAAG